MSTSGSEFLRGLVARGLKGVELVVSDAHVGLKKAIVAALAGASWQRCRVHFMRNVLSHVGREAQHLVGAAVYGRSISLAGIWPLLLDSDGHLN